MNTEEQKYETDKPRGMNRWLVAIIVIIIASAISWVMVTNLAVSKSDYASEIKGINNTIGHITDSAASLGNFASYQNSRIDTLTDATQAHFDEVNNSIADANNRIDDSNNKISQTQSDLAVVKAQADNLKTQTDNLKTQTDTLKTQSTTLTSKLASVSQEADNTKSNLDTLNTKVNSLAAGLQITPSVSSGIITLTIQSDIAQTVAFRIDFRPTSDMPQAATLDASLAALYTTPPVTLTANLPVRGDYILFWSASAYHLGLISFTTMGTSLAAGTNTKSITFTTSGTYEILITPEYPTGTSTGSW